MCLYVLCVCLCVCLCSWDTNKKKEELSVNMPDSVDIPFTECGNTETRIIIFSVCLYVLCVCLCVCLCSWDTNKKKEELSVNMPDSVNIPFTECGNTETRIIIFSLCVFMCYVCVCACARVLESQRTDNKSWTYNTCKLRMYWNSSCPHKSSFILYKGRIKSTWLECITWDQAWGITFQFLKYSTY